MKRLFTTIQNAVSYFLLDGHGYGSEISSEQIASDYLGVVPPMNADNDGFGMPEWKVEWLNRQGMFEAELLTEHNMLLMKKGQGKRIIVDPADQGEVSIQKFQSELKTAIGKMSNRLKYVDTTQLSDNERTELTNQRLYHDKLQERLRLSTRGDGSSVKRKRLFRITA